MEEPTHQHELDSKEGRCKVCGTEARISYYGILICKPCKTFFFYHLNSTMPHTPCSNNQQCEISANRKCSCCRLRKCVALGMDPYYLTRGKITSYVKNASSESFPYPPCSTCNLQANDNFNEKGNDVSSSASSIQDGTDSISIPSTTNLCKVCGNTAKRRFYSVIACGSCAGFFNKHASIKRTHKPCEINQQCMITTNNLENCNCCRLKKCLAVGMTVKYVPSKWRFLFPCKTCDSTKMRDFNKSIEYLKSICEERFSATSSKTFREESMERQSESEIIDEKSLNFPDSATTHYPDDTLKEMNLNHDEKALQCTSIYNPNSSVSSQNPAHVENHEQISLEEGSEEKSAESVSPIQVRNDLRPNMSFTFSLNLSPPPPVYEGMDFENIAWEHPSD